MVWNEKQSEWLEICCEIKFLCYTEERKKNLKKKRKTQYFAASDLSPIHNKANYTSINQIKKIMVFHAVSIFYHH